MSAHVGYPKKIKLGNIMRYNHPGTGPTALEIDVLDGMILVDVPGLHGCLLLDYQDVDQIAAALTDAANKARQERSQLMED